MKVLVALADALNGPVSRDTLLWRCWDGRIVSDGALNRCIAQVRRVLESDPRLRIVTLPTIGYMLRVEEASQPANDDAAGFPADRRRRRLLLAVGIAVAALAAAAAYWARRPEWTSTLARPLTSSPGVEMQPALNPEGTLLAYSARGPDQSFDLFVRPTAGGAPRLVLGGGGDQTAAAWSPDGKSIALVQVTGARCELVVRDLASGRTRVAGACVGRDVGRPAWLGTRFLIYSERPGHDDLRRLVALDLASGGVTPILDPPPGGHGDSDPLVSPDGRMLLFRRTVSYGVDDLMVARIAQGPTVEGVRQLTTEGWKMPGAAWSADGRTVFFSSNCGGDWGLWAVASDGGEPRRISVGTNPISRISADRHDRVSAELGRGRSDLAWLDAPGAPIASVTADVWAPVAGPGGAVAYVSNESGTPELWLSSSGQARQLTSLQSNYIQRPAWSPDGRLLAFGAIKDRIPQLFVIDATGRGLRQITTGGADKRDVGFSADGRTLFYLGRVANGWQLMQVSLGGGESAPVPGLEARWDYMRAGGGQLLAVRAGDSALWRIDLTGPRPVQTRLPTQVGEGEQWVATSQGLIVARAAGVGQVEIVRRPWSGADRRIALFPKGTGAIPELVYDRTAGRIGLLSHSAQQSDIALFELARR